MYALLKTISEKTIHNKISFTTIIKNEEIHIFATNLGNHNLCLL